MAKHTFVKILCDICKKEVPSTLECRFNISVVFTTEQTEGRQVEPYLSAEQLDLCQECSGKVFKGNLPFAQGAQGHNKYYFKDSNG